MVPNIPKVVVSVSITIILVTSLVAFAQPAIAEVTIDGPDVVTHPETATFAAAVELNDGADLESLTVSFNPVDGDESVSFAVAPDGTLIGSTPERGVIGNGEIRVTLLANRLAITPTDEAPDSGYGYDYGYGYGYDDDGTVTAYVIEFDTRAFKAGEFELRVDAETDDGDTATDTEQFAVTLSSNSTPPGHASGPLHSSPPSHAAAASGANGPNAPTWSR